MHVVTLGRALELGHKPTVVSALSAETGQQFTVAGDALKTLEPAQFGKWASYLALKAAFYESYVSVAHPLLVCWIGWCLLSSRHIASLGRSCWFRRSVETPLKCCNTAKPVCQPCSDCTLHYVCMAINM